MKRIFLTCLAASLLAACSTTPYLDRHFGEASRQAMSRQIISSEAKNGPQKMDGQAANSVIDRYHKSYAVPPEPVNVFNIGVGAH
ncbi:MAG: hypothetical protein PSX71_03865 [bacterium]|nr:hypothetical protein [bacterium]